jgi:O-antigen/teichoic acid export membrane protein
MPLLVVALEGSSEGGHFFVAWTIATTIDLLASNLATSLTVEGALDQDRLAHFGREVLRRLALVLVPISLGTILLAGALLTPFGAGYRSHSANLLRLLAAASLPRALATVAIGVCRVERRVSRIAAVQAAQAILVLGLAALLLPRLGIVGAGVAALVGHTAVAVAVLPWLQKRLGGTP